MGSCFTKKRIRNNMDEDSIPELSTVMADLVLAILGMILALWAIGAFGFPWEENRPIQDVFFSGSAMLISILLFSKSYSSMTRYARIDED